MTSETKACCPPFQPEVWDEKEISWQGKPFVKDRVRSFLHIPLNFGTVMRQYAKSQGKNIKSLYFFYTTCPRCAKKYGKNYVVLLAQV